MGIHHVYVETLGGTCLIPKAAINAMVPHPTGSRTLT